MTEIEYRNVDAVSRSELWHIRESPEKFIYHVKNPEQPTPALLFGQLFHMVLLEPEKVEDSYAIAPEVDRRTKAGREAFAEFQKVAKGRTLITADMLAQAEAMRDSVMANGYARKLLKGEHELPLFWTDKLTGEQCKCRLDCLCEVKDKLIVVDVKTADSAENGAFAKASVNHGYDFQAAMYSEGVNAVYGKIPIFVFIVVEKKPPYAVNIFQADELFCQRGYDVFRELIGIYSDCKKTGNWYGYLGAFNQINTLSLPPWAAREIE